MEVEMKKIPPTHKEYILPTVIRLGYQDIKVIEVDAIDDTQGSYTNETHEIKIKGGMNASETLNTVIHECLHAILYVYGAKEHFKNDDEEENLVNAMANGLTEVLVRNKDLVAFIEKSV
jgi:Zn-dependent peptidase ImmA (M78 family)